MEWRFTSAGNCLKDSLLFQRERRIEEEEQLKRVTLDISGDGVDFEDFNHPAACGDGNQRQAFACTAPQGDFIGVGMFCRVGADLEFNGQAFSLSQLE